MPEPMPEIEVGDWVLMDQHFPGGITAASVMLGRSEIAYAYRNVPLIREIRKADGRVWRREEPSR